MWETDTEALELDGFLACLFWKKHMICIYNYIYTHTKRWLKLYCREIGHSWACWKIGCHQKTVEKHIFSIKTAIILDIPHFGRDPHRSGSSGPH